MKKIVLALAISAAYFSSAFAQDDNFNIGWTNDDPKNAFLMNNMEGTFMQVEKDGALTFTVGDIASTASSVTFGVDIYGSDGALSQQIFDNLSTGDIFSVDFNAGENVNFWMEIDGKVVSMMDGSNASLPSYYPVYDPNDPTHLGLAFRDDRLSWTEGYWNTFINVESSGKLNNSTPSGQPLPGILLTVAFGAAVLMPYIKRKK